MLLKRALLGSAAAAAIGVPYVATETPLATMISGGSAEDANSSEDGVPVAPQVQNLNASIVPLGEVFRWDATPQWIFQRWGRVSTITAAGELKGYRVPLVTGTSSFDLAGSLTYYFDVNRTVQRIIFHGHTGDPQPLVQLATMQHGLRQQSTTDPGMQIYQAWSNGTAHSELRLQPANVVDASSPHARYAVNLLLERQAEFSRFRQSQPSATLQTRLGY